jgi:folate-binding protein YgfZ
VPSVQQALAKYIVFSKAELHDSSATWCRFAIWGDAATKCITETFGSAPNSYLGSIQNESSLAWGMQSETSEFIAYCRPEDKAQVIRLLEQRASLAEVNAWETLQIDQGLMYVTPDISDSYVPQMLNLQATGAIDFKKGCYTGQEIVARMQYLGKLKRHLFIGQVHSSQAVMVGQQIDANKRKNVGRITSAAPNGEHTYRFTAVINRTEAQAEELHLHEQDKSIISLSPLPYEIDPQVFERIKL